MDMFNGVSVGNGTRVIKFHSSSQGSPQLERIEGVSYGRALSSQSKGLSSERVEGVSYGKATRVMEIVSLNQWKAHFEASKQTQKLLLGVDLVRINDMAAKFIDVDFIKIDVDKLVTVSAQYGIQTMPTFILTKNGKEVDKVNGVKKEELQMKVMKHKTQVYC